MEKTIVRKTAGATFTWWKGSNNVSMPSGCGKRARMGDTGKMLADGVA